MPALKRQIKQLAMSSIVVLAAVAIFILHLQIAPDPKEYEYPECFYQKKFLNEDLDNPLKRY